MGKPLKPLDDLRQEVPSAMDPELRRRGVLDEARQRFLLDNPQAREELLVSMGQAVDEAHQAELKQRLDLARVRTRLLARPERRRSTRRWMWAASLGASAAVATALLVVLLGGARPLTFTVDSEAGEVGRWLSVAEADQALDMRFSDGSNLRLEPGTNSRVTRLTRDSAHVGLEQGTLDVRVVPNGDKLWVLAVGPFSVTVVGTRFQVSWDQKTKHFSMTMRRGKVMVHGPTLGERELVKGESVDVWVGARRMVFTAAGARPVARVEATRPQEESEPVQVPRAPANKASLPLVGGEEVQGQAAPAKPERLAAAPKVHRRQARTGRQRASAPSSALPTQGTMPLEPPPSPPKPDREEPTPARETPPVAEPEAPVRDEPPPPAPAKDPPPPTASPRPWDLASSGKYSQAMAAARKIGWDKILTSARAEQLAALATAARTQGSPGIAMKLLKAIRRRFPATASAAEATFTLGTISVHQIKDHDDAASWFKLYLKQWPEGPLALAARGRLVECLHRAGRGAEACAAARAYRTDHPRGPHIRFVRKVLLRCPARGLTR